MSPATRHCLETLDVLTGTVNRIFGSHQGARSYSARNFFLQICTRSVEREDLFLNVALTDWQGAASSHLRLLRIKGVADMDAAARRFRLALAEIPLLREGPFGPETGLAATGRQDGLDGFRFKLVICGHAITDANLEAGPLRDRLKQSLDILAVHPGPAGPRRFTMAECARHIVRAPDADAAVLKMRALSDPTARPRKGCALPELREIRDDGSTEVAIPDPSAIRQWLARGTRISRDRPLQA